MGCIIDVNYRFWNPTTQQEQVGWPNPTPEQSLWADQRVAQLAKEFADIGFTAVRFWPACLAGGGRLSDGYDLKDPYNLDGTAFGSGDQLRQAIATIHANGMHAYGDLVLHQYGGGTAHNYPTKRFPKTASCFVGEPPGVGVDTVPDQAGNFPFGDMCSYQHSLPKDYMLNGAVQAAVWQTRTLNFDGYRIDDVKGTYVPCVAAVLRNVRQYVDYKGVGEYFEGSNGPLWNWVHNDMKGACAVLDFGFKFNVRDICNNNSNAWMGRLAEIGYCMIDSANAMTFVESADTDTSLGQQTIWNKLLGYAIMLTFPGYPSIYYRDWSDDPFCYGLKTPINNLVWIHEHFANGEFVVRHTSYQVFAHERAGLQGKPGLVAVFNNDQWNEYTVTLDTIHGANVRLHEYTGNAGWLDIWTNDKGQITCTVPRNNNGRGYLIFAVWQELDTPHNTSLFTTQVFEGAEDLVNTHPAMNGVQTVARFSAQKGTMIQTRLNVDRTGWADNAEISFEVLGPTGKLPTDADITTIGNDINFPTVPCHADESGWHTVQLTSTNLPEAGSWFEVTVSYMAPQVPIL